VQLTIRTLSDTYRLLTYAVTAVESDI